MYAIWGLGQMMFTKVIVVVDAGVNVQNTSEVLWRLGNNVDPRRDIVIVDGPLDALDHASPTPFYGGKIGIDATKKGPEEGHMREWPDSLVMIFDMDIETLPREDLEALQLKRLKNQCERVYANVAFYRRAFDEAGVKPSDIKSLADLRYLPFTEKQDLRNNYPFGLFAVPKDNVVRIHASSGTTGKASVAGYTQRDIANWATMRWRIGAMAQGPQQI